MAVIRPFCAVRPAVEYADKVAALPYDVYNRAEAKKEVEREPLSFLAIDRAETQFEDSVSVYAPEVYAKAKELFEERISQGIFIEDKQSAYYIYQLEMNGRTQTGIAACASVDDYLDGTIKKHENTREEKESGSYSACRHFVCTDGRSFWHIVPRQRSTNWCLRSWKRRNRCTILRQRMVLRTVCGR